MIYFPEIEIKETLSQSSRSIIYRGLQKQEQRPVVIKCLRKPVPRIRELNSFRKEFAFLNDLSLSGVVKPYALGKRENSLYIVMEDIGARSLADIMAERRPALKEFLRLAVRITEILGQVHENRIIHKDVNPSNIIWNPETDIVKLIDFGISTRLSEQTPVFQNPNMIEGTLAYMSPEQTGRMNRYIDYRSDLYSLGVTFYEMLTGSLPFTSDDPLELIHSHMARPPVSLLEHDPQLPPMVCEIILNLLDKNAEDRYQSASGLKTDLERCLHELRVNDRIEIFTIRQNDRSSGLQIPQKLYGRKADIKQLLDHFERVCRGSKDVVFVAGVAGIGKTSLIHEIHKNMPFTRGGFISGKFDPFQRNVPYAPLIGAFRQLVQQVLTEPENIVKSWKKAIMDSLGTNARVIIDVIPEIRWIIGTQPPVPELSPGESQNRFELAFNNFVRASTSIRHPLILFLDDLQWADVSTLNLMRLMIEDPGNHSMFLIGAYRDNEIDAGHPLTTFIRTMETSGFPIHTITPAPLNPDNVQKLLMDVFQTTSDMAPFSRALMKKTQGNPFFLKQLLLKLYHDRWIEYEYTTGTWRYDLKKIESAAISDNVVQLMAGKIRTLAPETVRVIRNASCIGNVFDLMTLAHINETDPVKTSQSLQTAIEEGLIVPLTDSWEFAAHDLERDVQRDEPEKHSRERSHVPEYRFLHDRVRQAALSEVSDQRRQVLSRKIGNYFLKNSSLEDREKKLFSIVNHLNSGKDELKTPQERTRLIRLNRLAGKKARDSAAYDQALVYFEAAIALLKDDNLQENDELPIKIYTEAAEAAYLNTRFDRMNYYGDMVMSRAKTLLDKAAIFELRMQGLYAQNKLSEAIDEGIKALNLFGYRIPKNPRKINVLLAYIKTRRALKGRDIRQLKNMPDMTDPELIAANYIRGRLGISAYQTRPMLMPISVFMGVNMVLKHGYYPGTPFLFTAYGMILCAVMGDIDTGYQIGELALALNNRPGAIRQKARTIAMAHCFIRHWKHHVNDTLKPLLIAHHLAIETGDFEYGPRALCVYCFISLLVGKPLKALEAEAEDYRRAIRRYKQEASLTFIEMTLQTIVNLQGRSKDPTRLEGDIYSETKRMPVHVQADDRQAICLASLYKMILCYLFGFNDRAEDASKTAESLMDSLTGQYLVPIFYFYDTLIRFARYPDLSAAEQRRCMKKTDKNRQKMKRWADHAPMNYRHKWALMEAERMRLTGRHHEAVVYYRQAIEGAGKHDFLIEQALAYELYARYWHPTDSQTAHFYALQAYLGYRDWQADAKVRHLQSVYPEIRLQVENTQRRVQRKPLSTSHGQQDDASFDLNSVLKAARAISKEIDLKKLLDRMMALMIENAGAQNGLLLIENSGKWYIEAGSSMLPAGKIPSLPVLIDLDASEVSELPVSVVRYVYRTKKFVVLNDASRHGAYVNDAYIIKQHPRAVICGPIQHQSSVIGMVYMENNLAAGSFTDDRIEVIRLLASQAAISIENARLYTRLAASEKKYRKLFENAHEGIFQTTPEGRIVSANPAAIKLFGYDDPKSLINSETHIAEQCYADPQDRVRLMDRLIDQDSLTDVEVRMKRKDGRLFWSSISIRKVYDQNGGLLLEGSLVDITERKEREKAQREKEIAQRSAQIKGEFLADMSHEIRTPMNAILGLTHLLQSTRMHPRQTDYVTKITSSAQSLLGIINDILDVSKIEAGKMTIESIVFNLEDTLAAPAHMMVMKAEEKGLELLVDISENVPRTLIGDPLRLGQILINLMSNAIKFTETGHVIVSIGTGASGKRLNLHKIMIEIRVTDTGIGMSSDQVDRLFNAFVQTDPSITRLYGGTGLGLTICKRLVEMMDGHIRVQSKPGKGSVFSVVIPFGLESADFSSAYPCPVELKNMHVLVVDDHDRARQMLADILRRFDFLPETAASGELALEMIASEKNRFFKLIFIDCDMSGSDSIKTCRKIRADSRYAGTPVLLMVTPARWERVRNQAKNAGFSGFILKPIMPGSLLDAVMESLWTPEETTSRAFVKQESRIPGMDKIRGARVLLVEDNPLNQQVATELLSNEGLNVTVVSNGQRALDKISESNAEPPFDLILMDIRMPVMDGYKASGCIRNLSSKNSQVPIIAMTAHAMTTEKKACLDAGMNDYLSKPIDPAHLFEKLVQWIKK